MKNKILLFVFLLSATGLLAQCRTRQDTNKATADTTKTEVQKAEPTTEKTVATNEVEEKKQEFHHVPYLYNIVFKEQNYE